jgi:hypothetical protein
MESFTGRDEAEHDLPVDNPVLATLTTVVNRIVNSEVLEAIAQLIYWVNAMHFAALIMRFVTALIHWHMLTECLFHREAKRTQRKPVELFKMVADDMGWIGPAKIGVPLLQRYYHNGTAVAMMAAAGEWTKISSLLPTLTLTLTCCRFHVSSHCNVLLPCSPGYPGTQRGVLWSHCLGTANAAL